VSEQILVELFCGVAHCGRRGIAMLQDGYNEIREDGKAALVEDGIVGAITSRVLGEFCRKPEYAKALLAVYRYKLGSWYMALKRRDPGQRKFIRGWMGRLV
jgi:hypothetical protein